MALAEQEFASLGPYKQEQVMTGLKFKLAACAFGVTAFMATGLVSAQTTNSATAEPTKTKAHVQLSAGDRKFMEEAASGGMAEVELGKLAEQKAANVQVKQFGARMVQDHTKANNELKQLAQSKGIDVPAAPAKSQQKHVEALSKLSGAEFDRQYMAHMLSDHRKDVAEFKKASEDAKDGDVKAFAGKTLPTLQEHLTLAQSVNDNVKTVK